jgi:transcriptional regulator with XRE-family HTH domain
VSSARLAPLLRRARAGADLSLRDLGEKTGLAHSYLHRLERGEVDSPNPDVLRRLAAHLRGHVTYTQLMKAAGYL